MASNAADRLQSARPYQGGYFQQIGSEEAHTVESFERRIGATDTTEPRREFSTNQYTERRTYGKDENGDLVVKIDKDPKEPVRPVTPVEPVMPVGRGYPGEQLLKPIKPLETLPLQIPRIEVGSRAHSRTENYYPTTQNYNSYGGRRSAASGALSPRAPLQGGHSPRSVDSGPLASPRSTTSSAGSGVSAGGTPIKKIIKKTRLVSVYDGRPLSPYVESVTYEPKYGGPKRFEFAKDHLEPRSVSRYEENWGRPLNGYDPSPRSNSRLSFGSRLSASPQPARPFSSASRRTSAQDECSMLVHNPLYSGY